MKKITIWGIVFIIVISSLMHFLYEATGRWIVSGIISPINESLWEHLKMPLIPTLLWWIISYHLIKKKGVDLDKWVLSGMISFLITIFVIIAFYYIYTGTLGIHSVVLDIFSLILGVILGVTKAISVYQNKELKSYQYYLVYLVFFVVVLMLIVFTFKTPNLPIFKVPNHS